MISTTRNDCFLYICYWLKSNREYFIFLCDFPSQCDQYVHCCFASALSMSQVSVYALISAQSPFYWSDYRSIRSQYISGETLFNLAAAGTGRMVGVGPTYKSYNVIERQNKMFNTSRLVQLTAITYISFTIFFFRFELAIEKSKTNTGKTRNQLGGGWSTDEKPIFILQITIIKWIIGFFARVAWVACQLAELNVFAECANRQNVTVTGWRLVWVMKSFMQQVMVKCIETRPNRIVVCGEWSGRREYTVVIIIMPNQHQDNWKEQFRCNATAIYSRLKANNR